MSNAVLLDDQQLATAFQQGDRDAFNKVYHRYHAEVRSRVGRYVYTGLRSEVDDICQHFWLELHKYAHSYDPRRPLRNWLFAASCKATSGYFRSIARKRTINLIGNGFVPLESDETEGCPVDSQRGPEEAAIFNERLEAVREAVKEIPPQFGDAIEAIYLRHERPTAFAQEKGIAESTVYTRLNRGLKHLKQTLAHVDI